MLVRRDSGSSSWTERSTPLRIVITRPGEMT